MVLIEWTDQLACLAQPFLECRQLLLAEGTRLIAYLPWHDGWIVLIFFLCISIGSSKNETHVIIEELVSLITGSILSHEIHECRIAILIRTWRLAQTCLLQIIAVTAAPFPGIVEIEHSHHLAFAHLHQEIIETGKYGIIINARCFLQGRFHLGLHSTLAIGTHQDAQVVDAHLLHLVKFTAESFPVAALSLWAQDSAIPEVGAYIIIRFTITNEMSVLYLYEVWLC